MGFLNFQNSENAEALVGILPKGKAKDDRKRTPYRLLGMRILTDNKSVVSPTARWVHGKNNLKKGEQNNDVETVLQEVTERN